MKMNRIIMRAFAACLIAIGILPIPIYLVFASPPLQTADQGAALFKQKCAVCHTIGKGDLVGPDLQGVTQLRDTAWLKSFISAPDQVIASGDPVATQLVAQFNNLKMPNLGLTPDQVDALIAYLSAPAPAAGQATPTATLIGNPARGEAIFLGQTPLQNGGYQCMACHTVAGLPSLGGGTLGPDLTHVLPRYGQPGLASALGTLPFTTMQGIFATRPLTPAEQADLLAFFIQADKSSALTATQTVQWFWLAGGLGMLVLFGVMAFYWPRQRRSISDRLRDQA